MDGAQLFGGERIGPRGGRAVHLLNTEGNHPFYLQHHPLRHDVVGRGPDASLLPCLGVLVLEPGSQGIREGGNLDLCLEMQRRRGWTVLIPDTDYPQSKIPDYRMRYPSKKGGYYHCCHWTAPRQVGGQVLPPVVNHAGYTAWLRTLIATGVIEPIAKGVHELLVMRCERDVKRAEQTSRKLGRDTPRLVLYRQRLAILRRGYKEQQDLATLGITQRGGDRIAALELELKALRSEVLDYEPPAARSAGPVPTGAVLEPGEPEPEPVPAAPALQSGEPVLVAPETRTALAGQLQADRRTELQAMSFAELREIGEALAVGGRSSAVLIDRILGAEQAAAAALVGSEA